MTLLIQKYSPAVVGAALMVLAGAVFALINTLVQHAVMIENASPTSVAFWQYAIALCVMLPSVIGTGRSALRTAVPGLHVLRVALAAGGVQFWVFGLAYVPIWQAIALIMLSPFFVTLGAGFILRERVSLQRWIAVSIGFAGGMVILAPWSDTFTLQAFLPVGAAAFWAGSSLLTKRMTATESSETLTVYLLLLLTPVNAGLALGDGFHIDLASLGAVIIAVGLLTALAQYALVSSYRIADASFLQPFDHVKLPFNVGLGALVFGFIPPGTMWLGSLMIIGGSVYLVWIEKDQVSTGT
ncbi:DMT family transporter [Candidatus Rhodobacter oscarellae]|uniref:DMT family transporter n=1 Tax=Candidatus Rhodobacter oscarellae TaxID=1675527 RepID=UPI0006713BD3|nr:DMT family transporter [Candidatus Rhodobacter lobularis]